MASGSQVRAKVKATLAKLQATPRVVQFREVTYDGGNARLGIGGTPTVTLTAIDPQPAVEMVITETIAGLNGLALPGDYRFIFDGDIAESVFRNQQILFGDEVLNIVQIEPYALSGLVVGWSVLARTTQPRS